MKALVRILTTTLFLLFVFSAYAQRGERNVDPAERAKQQTERMAEALSLSTKQAEKVGEINLKYAQKMKEARENRKSHDKEGWTAMRETMMKMREELKTEMKGVMTSAQFSQWESAEEERMKERRQRRGDRRPKDGSINKEKSQGN